MSIYLECSERAGLGFRVAPGDDQTARNRSLFGPYMSSGIRNPAVRIVFWRFLVALRVKLPNAALRRELLGGSQFPPLGSRSMNDKRGRCSERAGD